MTEQIFKPSPNPDQPLPPPAPMVPASDAADPMAELYRDLAAAQGEFRTPAKNCINPAFKSRYADLANILAATRPSLNAHGLALIQKVRSEEGGVVVETMLLHRSGASLSSGELYVPCGKSSNPAQAFGSARTYACRYSLSSFLGVAADDDDDANGAAGPAPAPRQPDLTPSAELIARAQKAAEQGMQSYQAFYTSLPSIDKNRLYKGPGQWHQKLKATAQAHDDATTENSSEIE